MVPSGRTKTCPREARWSILIWTSRSPSGARTLRQLSPESSDLFTTFLQREIDRLKLSGAGAPEVAQIQLRQFMREG